jgi:SAM-dependent methyltransferase
MVGLIQAEHEARYSWATAIVPGKRVLDAGCGVGYGTRMCVKAGAAAAVGVDISSEAVEDALFRAGDVAEFVVASLEHLPFESGSFDLAICFETIEHVADQPRALDELSRVLGLNGVLLISSPNRNVYTPGNPHHLHEYTPAELRDALGERFGNVALYRQHQWVASLITDDDGLRLRDIARELPTRVYKVETAEPGEEVYTLAAASNAPLPKLGGTAVLTEALEVKEWHDRVRAAEGRVELLEAEYERAQKTLDASWARRLRKLAARLTSLRP